MARFTLSSEGNTFGGALRAGRLSITFQRTLRIPDDGKVYPLPPGLGTFPIRRVRDYARRVPAAWRERGGYFIPMYQREALWICFHGAYWKPSAVKVGVGGVNAVSGQPWDAVLRSEPQDYVVTPGQPWLDGINAGEGMIRQFVAMPLGLGYTVEAQVTGKEEEGGLQLMVFEPRAGRFPSRRPRRGARSGQFAEMAVFCVCESDTFEMGLAAGGRMRQRIYPDAHGLDCWDQARYASAFVHVVNSEMYRAITGEAPPPSPIDARTYTEYGLPWFALYDQDKGDVAAPEVLQAVKSVAAVDAAKLGVVQADEGSVEIPQEQVVSLGMVPVGE